MLICCPYCGLRDHAEFAYGGDASIEWPALDAPADAWVKAVYERDNPRGPQWETWQHVHGCRLWLRVHRDTVTHEILDVQIASPAHAPDAADET